MRIISGNGTVPVSSPNILSSVTGDLYCKLWSINTSTLAITEEASGLDSVRHFLYVDGINW